MKLLKWIFNVLRTLSFFIVLFLLALVGYFVLYPEQAEEFLAPSPAASAWDVYEEEPEGEVRSFEVEEEVEAFGQKGHENIKEGQEYKTSNFSSKLKIKTKKGFVFLRPSQVVSIHSGKPFHTLTTIQGKTKSIYNRDHSLTSIHDLLSSYSCFFKMKQSVINCHYIEQIEENKGVYKVILENNVVVPLPEEQVNVLIRKLENL